MIAPRLVIWIQVTILFSFKCKLLVYASGACTRLSSFALMMPYNISCYCLSFMTILDRCLHCVVPMCAKRWMLHMQVWWVSDKVWPAPFKMNKRLHLNMSQSFFCGLICRMGQVSHWNYWLKALKDPETCKNTGKYREAPYKEDKWGPDDYLVDDHCLLVNSWNPP